MPTDRDESRLRQGAQGTLFVIGLGLTICLVGLLVATLLVWVLA
jgi:hypothetical protein